MSHDRRYRRIATLARRLLHDAEWELDFGPFALLAARTASIERFLADELPDAIERSSVPSIHEPVVELLERFLSSGLKDKPADDVSPSHVHCPSPLPRYAFRLGDGRRVVFERAACPSAANGPLGLASDSPVSQDDRELTVRFEDQRPATAAHHKASPKRAWAEVRKLLANTPWLSSLGQARKVASRSLTTFEFHLARFTGWHRQPFMLRPDLARELTGQLDRLLAETLLAPARLLHQDSTAQSSALEQSRLVRDLASRLIAWADQRETALVHLWNQPRFIAEVTWSFTLDLVPAELRGEVASNEAQRNAWREQLALDGPPAALNDDCRLPIDGRLFPPEFVKGVLQSIDRLDERLDGLVIHGENHAALRLLAPAWRERVRCVFIDPPYNTGSKVWSYDDGFAHSVWRAMMRDRLSIAHELLDERGALFASLDDHEQARLRLLLDELFGEAQFLATIVWEKVHTRKNSARHFSVSHDYIPAFAKNKDLWTRHLLPREQTDAYTNPDDDPRGPWKPDPVYANKPYGAQYKIAKPSGAILEPPPGRYWRFSEANFLAKVARGEVLWGEGDAYPLVKRYLADVQSGLVPVTLFTRDFAGDNTSAAAELRGLFGELPSVSYPKPSRLVERILQIALPPADGQVVLDFFAGSGTTGHAVLNQNRLLGCRRKFILVEQGPCCDTVVRSRLTKAAYASRWQAGRPMTIEPLGQFVQYVRLETFEEALCREPFPSASGSQGPLTPGPSPTRGEGSWHWPGDVDPVETLAWLLGLSVERRCSIGPSRILDGLDRAGQRVLIVWTPENEPTAVACETLLSDWLEANAASGHVYAREAARWSDELRAQLGSRLLDADAELHRLLRNNGGQGPP